MITARSNAKEAAAELRALAAEYPQHMRAAVKGAGLRMRDRLRKDIRGNRPPLSFAPLSETTVAVRASQNQTVNDFGGVLAKTMTTRMQGDSVVVAWPGGLHPYGRQFQSADRRPYTKDERRRLYALGISPDAAGYNRPARDVMRTMASAVETWFPQFYQDVKARIMRAVRKASQQARVR